MARVKAFGHRNAENRQRGGRDAAKEKESGVKAVVVDDCPRDELAQRGANADGAIDRAQRHVETARPRRQIRYHEDGDDPEIPAPIPSRI